MSEIQVTEVPFVAQRPGSSSSTGLPSRLQFVFRLLTLCTSLKAAAERLPLPPAPERCCRPVPAGRAQYRGRALGGAPAPAAAA